MTMSLMPERVDLLVRHAYLLTMDDERRIVADGAVAISQGLIVEVGEDGVVAGRYQPDRTIDAKGAPAHPGLIESHLHASYQLYRSAIADHLAEDDIYEYQDLFLNGVGEEEEYQGVLLGSLEMIRNGTTCFMEAGTIFHPAAAAAAAEELGIRALIADAFVMDCPDGFAQGAELPGSRLSESRRRINGATKSIDEALKRLGQQLFRNADRDALVRGHIAVLGLGTASEELVLEAKRMADSAGVVLNMHQSYSPADTEADKLKFGRDPLVHLAEIGVLDSNVTLGHANYLTDAECRALIDSRTNVAWAPAASMMWGHGTSLHGRHAELWRRGANISLASDSGNWSNCFDLFRQANIALLTARDVHGDRGFLVAEDMLDMATRAGAISLGLADQIGSIETGKRADLVIHSLARPELIPATSMIRNLIYSSGSKSVSTVIVNGRVVLSDGSFVSFDEEQLLGKVNESALKLLKRVGFPVEANDLTRLSTRDRRSGF